ncbi:hypothetical protein Ddc_13861 [Ditylenchus destructor]|nr:hypothetical protein Ddc_13861 [Ditylenchus destructor]
MTCLEYLHISGVNVLFDQKAFVQFPPSLKYLALYSINNTDRILSWVAKGCKDLKGLRLSGHSLGRDTLQAISQMKSLTYLALKLASVPIHFEYVFEALTELQALEINALDETVLTWITKYCKKLKHLSVREKSEFDSEIQPNLLRLTSLPKLCSLTIGCRYSKEQTTELMERLVAKKNLQHVNMFSWQEPLEPEVLFKMLRQCKKIRTIYLNFGQIDTDLYSKICQVVDEIDERDRQQREFPEETHPMVEMEYHGTLPDNIMQPYKWFRLTDKDSLLAPFEKWEYGWLSAGKP